MIDLSNDLCYNIYSKRNKQSKVVIIFFLFLALIVCFTGISYAIFDYFGKGMTSNVLQTGRVVFSYSDANGGSNGIFIENAVPIPDGQGKILIGEREYFDFSVSASSAGSNLVYEITVNKDSKSTLNDDWIKIYLTTFEGNQEKETPLTMTNGKVVSYHDLKDTTNKLLTGKTIYYGNVDSGDIAYGKKFRLRMWIKMPTDENYEYEEISNKTFSVKVNVAASSIY